MDKNKTGFSLVELLVVIATGSLLLGILMPSLQGARHLAYQTVCSSNISAVALGLIMYSQSWDDFLPAAYTYIESGPDNPLISHWSFVLKNEGVISEKHTTCPVFGRQGLPPQSTTEDNLEQGQVSVVAGKIDSQIPRCAYTVNEALCPRNRFTVGFEGAIRPNRYVRCSEIKMARGTILATEWTTDWKMLSVAGTGTCCSYLPVHGVKALGTSSHYNLNSVPIDPDKPCFKGGVYEKLTASDLSLWQSTSRVDPPHLDWVGRNHGLCNSTKKDMRKGNFAYVDGHVECKSVYDTLSPTFEWGYRVYSIDSGADAMIK